MSQVAENRSNVGVYAGLLERLEAEPTLLPFMVAGLLGTVLGVLLLSIAWWRSRTAPRWVAPMLWAFLVVEFVGSNLSAWATYLSVLLYLVSVCTVAVRLAADPVREPVTAQVG